MGWIKHHLEVQLSRAMPCGHPSRNPSSPFRPSMPCASSRPPRAAPARRPGGRDQPPRRRSRAPRLRRLARLHRRDCRAAPADPPRGHAQAGDAVRGGAGAGRQPGPAGGARPVAPTWKPGRHSTTSAGTATGRTGSPRMARSRARARRAPVRSGLARQQRQQAVRAQRVVVVDVLVAERDPVDPLRDQLLQRVLDLSRMAEIREAARHPARQAGPAAATSVTAHCRAR